MIHKRIVPFKRLLNKSLERILSDMDPEKNFEKESDKSESGGDSLRK